MIHILVPILVYVFVVLILYTMFESGTQHSQSIQLKNIQQSLDKLNRPPVTQQKQPEVIDLANIQLQDINKFILEGGYDVSAYEVIKLSDLQPAVKLDK